MYIVGSYASGLPWRHPLCERAANLGTVLSFHSCTIFNKHIIMGKTLLLVENMSPHPSDAYSPRKNELYHPAAMEVMVSPDNDETTTGVGLSVMEPSPN